MPAPLQQRRSVNLAQHLPVQIGAQLIQFCSFLGREGLVGVFVQQLLVAIHLGRGGATASNAPQGRVVQPVQGRQIGLQFGWRGFPGGRAANLQGAQHSRLKGLPGGLGSLLQPQVQVFRQLHGNGSQGHRIFLTLQSPHLERWINADEIIP